MSSSSPQRFQSTCRLSHFGIGRLVYFLLCCLLLLPLMEVTARPNVEETADSNSLESVPESQREILRYNVAQSEPAGMTDADSSTNVSEEREFRARSRNAFLSLRPQGPMVEAPLLPEETRRQKWLQQHRAKKEKLERKNRPNALARLPAHVLQKNQTCKSDFFKHKIRMAGCEPKVILNRFCHGSCTSYFIPKARSKKLKATFQSCAACVPSETDLIRVKLDCPDREEKEIYRTVVRVKRCACRELSIGDELSDEG
jgi:hypothetical protein